MDQILHYTRETIDGGIPYTLVVPHNLKTKALQYAHEISGHLGPKKYKKCRRVILLVQLEGRGL